MPSENTGDKPTISASSATEIVKQMFENLLSPEEVRLFVAESVVCDWSSYGTPELKRIMPWAGATHGREAFLENLLTILRFRVIERMTIEESFSQGDRLAVFGSFTHRSRTLGKVTHSPFALLVQVSKGQIAYLQFLEDTFAAALSFRAGGRWTVRADPEAGELQI